jgi:tRNA 2-thiouridine synthesizing protein A
MTADRRIDPPIHDWDAGDLGCGELLFALKLRMKDLAPGDRLRLVARDPGAKEDLPSWCNLTGHRLEKAEPPAFLIRKKED